MSKLKSLKKWADHFGAYFYDIKINEFGQKTVSMDKMNFSFTWEIASSTYPKLIMWILSLFTFATLVYILTMIGTVFIALSTFDLYTFIQLIITSSIHYIVALLSFPLTVILLFEGMAILMELCYFLKNKLFKEKFISIIWDYIYCVIYYKNPNTNSNIYKLELGSIKSPYLLDSIINTSAFSSFQNLKLFLNQFDFEQYDATINIKLHDLNKKLINIENQFFQTVIDEIQKHKLIYNALLYLPVKVIGGSWLRNIVDKAFDLALQELTDDDYKLINEIIAIPNYCYHMMKNENSEKMVCLSTSNTNETVINMIYSKAVVNTSN